MNEATTRTCRYPGCDRPSAESNPGEPGRPPEYCQDPEHTRATAFHARRKLKAQGGKQVPDDLGRPVSMAQGRVGELVPQFAEQVKALRALAERVAGELETLADPEAAAAQIEAVNAEAEQKVAEATSRALKAEAGLREARGDQAEAEAAAEEAILDAEARTAALTATQAELVSTKAHVDDLSTQLQEAQVQAQQAQERAARAESHAAHLASEIERLARGLSAAEEDARQVRETSTNAQIALARVEAQLAAEQAATEQRLHDLRAVTDQRVAELHAHYESLVQQPDPADASPPQGGGSRPSRSRTSS